MKSNLKWFFKITTITSYLKVTSKIPEKGPLESLKGKVISNSSFTLSNFLWVARNIEKKKRKKNDLFLVTKMTKYVLQLYICAATFYGFHMLSKFVQSQCLRSDTWWWWIVFVVSLTNKRSLALFPARTTVRDPHHCKSPTCREQGLNLHRTWVQA